MVITPILPMAKGGGSFRKRIHTRVAAERNGGAKSGKSNRVKGGIDE
jgi:hypothetical protein